jgi:hypothetical protein
MSRLKPVIFWATVLIVTCLVVVAGSLATTKPIMGPRDVNSTDTSKAQYVFATVDTVVRAKIHQKSDSVPCPRVFSRDVVPTFCDPSDWVPKSTAIWSTDMFLKKPSHK